MKTAFASKDQMVELGIGFLKAFKGIENAPKKRVTILCENPAIVREIAESIVKAAESVSDLVSHQLAEWVSLYTSLGITLDPSEIKIPPRQENKEEDA